MHPYSIDVSRNKIIFYVSLMSIIFASLLAYGLNALPGSHIAIPITSLTLFLLGMRIVNRSLWTKRPFHTLGIIRTPIIRGKYRGQFGTEESMTEMTCAIRQTWTKMSVQMEWEDGLFVSTAAAIRMEEPLGPTVIVNGLLYEKRDGWHERITEGTVHLILKKDDWYGFYYMYEQGKGQRGHFELEKSVE